MPLKKLIANRTDRIHVLLSLWSNKQRVGATLTVAWLLATCLACHVQAQSQTQPPFPIWNAVQSTGSITVSVTDEQGAPLAVPPDVFVTAATPDGSVMGILSRKEGEDWVFSNLEAGAQYVVTARALGFQTAEQFVNLPDVRFASTHVKFFLVPLNGQSDLATPAGGAILAPRAEREVREGVKDLESNRVGSAQKHFRRALDMAPGNPIVNCLMGESWLRAGNVQKATKYLENSISLDPDQPEALLELGRIHYQQGNMPKAVEFLNRAVLSAPHSWQTHWLLGAALLRERDYQQAREQAKSALRYGKKKADPAKITLAIALANLGKRDKARKMLVGYLKQHPDDPHVQQIRMIVEKLRRPRLPSH